MVREEEKSLADMNPSARFRIQLHSAVVTVDWELVQWREENSNWRREENRREEKSNWRREENRRELASHVIEPCYGVA